MLNLLDKKYINELLDYEKERYPKTLIHASKGREAFDLHSQMVSLDDDWLEKFSEKDKKKSLLLVIIQTTVSKATLKNPEKKPTRSRQRIQVIFNIPGSSEVRTYYGSSSSNGKKCLELLNENKQLDLS